MADFTELVAKTWATIAAERAAKAACDDANDKTLAAEADRREAYAVYMAASVACEDAKYAHLKACEVYEAAAKNTADAADAQNAVDAAGAAWHGLTGG